MRLCPFRVAGAGRSHFTSVSVKAQMHVANKNSSVEIVHTLN